MTARVRGIVGSNPVTPDAFISSKFKYKYKLKRESKCKYKFEGKSKYKYNRKCVYMALCSIQWCQASLMRFIHTLLSNVGWSRGFTAMTKSREICFLHISSGRKLHRCPTPPFAARALKIMSIND